MHRPIATLLVVLGLSLALAQDSLGDNLARIAEYFGPRMQQLDEAVANPYRVSLERYLAEVGQDTLRCDPDDTAVFLIEGAGFSFGLAFYTMWQYAGDTLLPWRVQAGRLQYLGIDGASGMYYAAEYRSIPQSKGSAGFLAVCSIQP